jgi:hypothetical protein
LRIILGIMSRLLLPLALAVNVASAGTLGTLMTDPQRHGADIQNLLCNTMRQAGVEAILPGEEPRTRRNFEAPIPGIPCELRNSSGEVFVLAVVNGPDLTPGAIFAEQRAKARAGDAGRFVDEPHIPAFAWRDGHRLEYFALADGVVVIFQFHIHGADEACLLAFARRVVARLREPPAIPNARR